jgi:CheY-like chemotaxis protein
MSMLTAPVAIASLVGITSIAIVVACAATRRALAASAALRASQAKRGNDRKIEAGSGLPHEVAHGLADLLTAITGHAELLIATLDPSGASIQAAREIRRAALSAARLAAPMATQDRSNTHEERDAAGGASAEHVPIAVAETGRGMAANARPRPFEPFRAGEAASVAPTAVARSDAIVKHGGERTRIAPAAGVGRTFTSGVPAASQPPAGPPSSAEETRLGAPVLIVEDEPHVRELIRVVLVRAGHKVLAVAGPHAALAELNRQPAISLMLVDVVMPEMDGYDLVVEARKIAPGVRVVLMSGFARDPARHPSGDGFLVKPFTAESLTAIVERALDAQLSRPLH